MKHAVLVGALLLATLSGCGTIGPPIPPEDIGVAAKLEKEKARAKLESLPTEKDKDEDRPEDEEQQLSLPR